MRRRRRMRMRKRGGRGGKHVLGKKGGAVCVGGKGLK